MKNNIGLNAEKAKDIAASLNDLLANYQVFYQNLRGFHWNVKGTSFFELHLKFEELYEDAVLKVDEIAERVLTLGSVPLHTFEDYLQQAEIQSHKEDVAGIESVKIVISNFSTLIQKEREILKKASNVGDEGTISQMSEYITQTEKTLWMLHAYVS